MTTITLTEIQQDVAGYLRRVQAGEALAITDHNRAFAEIKPLAPAANGQRPFGLCADEIHIPDAFDAPLPDDVLREFGSL